MARWRVLADRRYIATHKQTNSEHVKPKFTSCLIIYKNCDSVTHIGLLTFARNLVAMGFLRKFARSVFLRVDPMGEVVSDLSTAFKKMS